MKILLVERNLFTRLGVRLFLEAHLTSEKLEWVEIETPIIDDCNYVLSGIDIIITEFPLSNRNFRGLAKSVTSQSINTKIIVLTSHLEPDTIKNSISNGIHGYVSKVSSSVELLNCILYGSAETPYLCPLSFKNVSTGLFWPNPRKSIGLGSIRFKAHERKIMQLICDQQTTKQIANEMQLASRTVDHYRQDIQEKIGAKNAVGIALFAIINGFVSLNIQD